MSDDSLLSWKEADVTDDLTKIEDDLEQARAQLHQTLEQIDQKVEAVGTALVRSEAVPWVKPILSVSLAEVVGFAIGMADNRGRTFGLLIGFSGLRSLSLGDSRCE